MKPEWTCWPTSYLHECGEYVTTGNHQCRLVLWSPEDCYDDAKKVEVVIEVSGRRHAWVSLKYFGQTRTLWHFKVKSVRHAIRKTDYRLRGKQRWLIRAAYHWIYQRNNWGCLYRDGQPVASIYRYDWELRHNHEVFGREFVLVFRDFNRRLEIWRQTATSCGWCGQGLKPSPEFQYWIAA